MSYLTYYHAAVDAIAVGTIRHWLGLDTSIGSTHDTWFDRV
jgi:hypothetical protein